MKDESLHRDRLRAEEALSTRMIGDAILLTTHGFIWKLERKLTFSFTLAA